MATAPQQYETALHKMQGISDGLPYNYLNFISLNAGARNWFAK
jgi:hypothetical protein